jgi:MYXO-CTERM domain-containing protein
MAFNGTTAVMFGGTSGTLQNKTWLWTGNDWADGCTGGCSPPSARQGPAMAFAGAGKVLLFGGNNGGDETWEYANSGWTLKCTACVSGTSKPSARGYAAMAYAGGSSVLLFGGSAGADETWLWNGTQWAKKCAACVSNDSKPAGRSHHAMTWDENRQKVVLFGGDIAGADNSETWEWDGPNDEWVKTATATPTARANGSLFYDVTNKRAVLYGGSINSVETGETYEYHARGGDCSSAADCNTGFCKDGKCCETACTGDCKTCAGANYGLCENVGSAAGVEDADTCSGSEACNAGAVCKLKQGEACSAANGSECLSTFCSDGRCCNSACGTACKTCANAQGTCSNVTKLSTDNSPACSGNSACDGAGACKEANGQTCSAAAECASGFCVDGRCCESSCTDSCKSCANAAGTCTSNVSKGSSDTNASPACSGNSACDGAGSCKKANGQSCGADDAQCASGFCADGKCCDSACDGACNECSDGSCSIVVAGTTGSPSCAPYACNGSSAGCPTTCSNDDSCAPDHHCKQNVCVPDASVGAACDRDRQCEGNQNCVDGFCCNAACGGPCRACSNATKGSGADGECGDIVDGAAPRAPGCALGATVCLADGKCDGAGSCRNFAPNTAPCGAGTVCTNNAVSGQLCDGQGNCQAGGGSQPCAPALCVGGTCNTSCADNEDCHASGFCAGTVCAEKLNDGESCGAADECQNGHCVDGVCCNNACDGACQACATGACQLREAGAVGGPSCSPFVCDGISELCPDSCTSDDVCIATYFCKLSDNLCQPRENGTACTDDDQCPERFCVDGVCCAEACDGQCEHCDADGACVATDGAPRGQRDACAGHSDCAGSCDGRDRTQCSGTKAAGTPCGAASCSANIATFGECDASADCQETSTDCDPYVCGESSCKTSCARDSDCKAGFSCVDEACVPSAGGGVCDEMGVTLSSADGEVSDCTPFVCRAGECLRSCTASTDCQLGFACNTTQGNGVCEPLTLDDGGADDAGCGCRAAGAAPFGSPAGFGTLLALAGLLWRRRRQSARAA